MKKKLCCITVIVVLLLLSVTDEAFALSRSFLQKKCRDIMKRNPPKISIIYNYGQVSYDKSKTAEEIAEIKGNIGIGKGAKLDRKYEIQGLTLFNYYEQIQFSGRYEPLGDNFLCYYPAEVEIRIGYDKPVVYLKSSLKEDTCLYRLVMRHEQTHLDLAHKTLGLYAIILQKKIKGIVEETGAKVSRDIPEKVVEKFVKDYKLRLSALSELFRNVRQQQQEIIDTEENYQKESKICD